MIALRNMVPVRRERPTKNPTGENWSQHKPDLKIDFNESCGYCDSHDSFRHTYFEVDHFIPKSFFDGKGVITLTQYSNLVYSCKFCNNNKLSQWPSKSHDIFNDGLKGFIDPCDSEYDNQFYRTEDGGIMWKTDLGKWMFREAFKFDERAQSIKLLWNLRKLQIVIDELLEILNGYVEGSNEYNQINSRIGYFCTEYYKFHRELVTYYNSL